MYTWPRDGLIPAASAALESLWLFAWISFLLAASETASGVRYPYPWVFVLLFVPAVAGRFLDRSYWGPRWLRCCPLGCGCPRTLGWSCRWRVPTEPRWSR